MSKALGAAGLALLAALLLVLAGPPFDLWPLALVGLVPLYAAARDRAPLGAAALGWITGFVASVIGQSWGVEVVERFARLSTPAAVGLVLAACAWQGLVFALWAGGCSALARRGVPWMLSAPLALVVAEELVPFFFKWHLAITVWRAWPLLQVAELGGPAAVSALIALANIVVAEGAVAVVRRRATRSLAVGSAAFVVILLGGGLRAWQISAGRDAAPRLRVAVVQPNFGVMSLADRQARGSECIEELRRATGEAARQGADLVVWPESAWPYLVDRELSRAYGAGHPWEMAPGARVRLLVGALTHAFDTSNVYNSALLFSESGAVAGVYDKVSPVPFAEYIPMAGAYPEWEARLRERFPEWPDIRAGAEPRVLVDGALRVAVIICSEEIGPAAAAALARQRPNLLVSLANDAWFAGSAAPRQHLALAALRSVETRLDLVRATDTGVSAVVDALGRVALEGPEGRPAVLLADAALGTGAGVGAWTIAWFPWVCACVLAAAMLAGGRRPSAVPRESPASRP